MKFFSLFCIFIIFTIFSSGCQSKSNVLFSDDFSTTSNKWDQDTNSTISTDYYDNAYRITVNDTNYDAWANPDSLSFSDVQIEVDATKNGGPDYNDFGIICRYTSAKNFYYGVIGSDGFYAIFKKTKEGGIQLGSGAEQFSNKIMLGAAPNHIRFDCVGSTLTLYVNGTQIDQQTDGDYATGNVGLIAGSYKESGTDILFDNFIVNKP